MTQPSPTAALTDRAPDAALFRLPDGIVTASAFVAAARRLAASLPASGPAINLSSARHGFALGFAAALLRGHPSVLTSDRSDTRLQALFARLPGAYTLDAPWADPGETTAAPHVPADLLAALVFTSGSTGEPACHRKPWGALAARSRAAADAFGLRGGASLVATVPPQHMYGFELSVLLPLHAPVTVWCGPAFFPADIRAALAAMPTPRVLVTTPLQLRGLLTEGGAMPALWRVISATAPLDMALAQEAEARWGTEVHEIFGATEVGSIARRRTVAGPWWTTYPGVTLHADVDGVRVAAPFLPETALDDLVEPGGDGFRLIGRRSDMVKVGGHRASLAGLDRALAAVAGVQDGAFVAPAAEDRGTARMTALVVAPGLSPQAILAGLRGRIDPLFLPRRIVHVDRLPRNELGKLSATALRELAS